MFPIDTLPTLHYTSTHNNYHQPLEGEKVMASQDNVVTIPAVLFWAKLTTPETRFNPDNKKFSVDVCNLDEDAVKELGSIGLSVRNKDDERGDFLTATTIHKMTIKDEQDNIIPNDEIGNGTEAMVTINAYSTKAFPGPFNGLQGLSITALVRYNANSALIDSVEDQFVDAS